MFLNAGTDDRDGSTDADGELVDSETLEKNKQSEDLLMTGSTGDNVADLKILLIQPNTIKKRKYNV